ncbi:esterase-like activity of phytase family protein, partial [Mycobacterium tuberculosis]|nr:esterase-like activity of phytase family protein [Mycobacterium tuberculosis]
GLDYDAKSGLWYALSDDRSDNNPARFYALKLTYGSAAFTSVDFVKAVALQQADGTTYPNAKAGGDVPDPEAIRIDPETGKLWWTS